MTTDESQVKVLILFGHGELYNNAAFFLSETYHTLLCFTMAFHTCKMSQIQPDTSSLL